MSNSEQDRLVICQDSDLLDLYVKQSNIPNSGDGLFAKNYIREGQILCEYRGKVIKAKHAYHDLYKYEDKMIQVNDKFCIIGNSIAAKANDCIDFNKNYYKTEQYQNWVNNRQFPLLKGFSYNSEIYTLGNKAFLKAKRDIYPDEEIFLSYGFDYWKWFYEK